MIDLSFLTEEEQEAIMKVLQRDAELKKAEEDRVRVLEDSIDDTNELKNKTGQWFYEAKSKRHRDKIHGADLIRASIRKKKPQTIAELSQSISERSKKSWVSNVNKDLFVPPELFGVMEEPDREDEEEKTQGQLYRSAPKVDNLAFSESEANIQKAVSSPSKQRRNPFNTTSHDNFDLTPENHISENGSARLHEIPEKDVLPISRKSQKSKNIPTIEFSETNQTSSDALIGPDIHEEKKVPKPKARTVTYKIADPQSDSDSSFSKPAMRNDSINGTGARKGILKRSPSSSSTDSEVLRVSYSIDSQSKPVAPTSPIPEGDVEKNDFGGPSEQFSQNSVDRFKQVRFTSISAPDELPETPDSHNGKEIGEFDLLESDYGKNSVDNSNGMNYLHNEHQSSEYRIPAHPETVDFDSNIAVTVSKEEDGDSELALALQSLPSKVDQDVRANVPSAKQVPSSSVIAVQPLPSNSEFLQDGPPAVFTNLRTPKDVSANGNEVPTNDTFSNNQSMDQLNIRSQTSEFVVDQQPIYAQIKSPRKLDSSDSLQGRESIDETEPSRKTEIILKKTLQPKNDDKRDNSNISHNLQCNRNVRVSDDVTFGNSTHVNGKCESAVNAGFSQVSEPVDGSDQNKVVGQSSQIDTLSDSTENEPISHKIGGILQKTDPSPKAVEAGLQVFNKQPIVEGKMQHNVFAKEQHNIFETPKGDVVEIVEKTDLPSKSNIDFNTALERLHREAHQIPFHPSQNTFANLSSKNAEQKSHFEPVIQNSFHSPHSVEGWEPFPEGHGAVANAFLPYQITEGNRHPINHPTTIAVAQEVIQRTKPPPNTSHEEFNSKLQRLHLENSVTYHNQQSHPGSPKGNTAGHSMTEGFPLPAHTVTWEQQSYPGSSGAQPLNREASEVILKTVAPPKPGLEEFKSNLDKLLIEASVPLNSVPTTVLKNIKKGDINVTEPQNITKCSTVKTVKETVVSRNTKYTEDKSKPEKLLANLKSSTHVRKPVDEGHCKYPKDESLCQGASEVIIKTDSLKKDKLSQFNERHSQRHSGEGETLVKEFTGEIPREQAVGNLQTVYSHQQQSLITSPLEETVERTTVPPHPDLVEFKAALEKLQREAQMSTSVLSPNSDALVKSEETFAFEEQVHSESPQKEVAGIVEQIETQDTVNTSVAQLPKESSSSLHTKILEEERSLNTSKEEDFHQEVREIIVKTDVPKNPELSDLKAGLQKLQTEASRPLLQIHQKSTAEMESQGMDSVQKTSLIKAPVVTNVQTVLPQTPHPSASFSGLETPPLHQKLLIQESTFHCPMVKAPLVEVKEVVMKTVSPKADIGEFKNGLKKLSMEASLSSFPVHQGIRIQTTIQEDTTPQTQALPIFPKEDQVEESTAPPKSELLEFEVRLKNVRREGLMSISSGHVESGDFKNQEHVKEGLTQSMSPGKEAAAPIEKTYSQLINDHCELNTGAHKLPMELPMPLNSKALHTQMSLQLTKDEHPKQEIKEVIVKTDIPTKTEHKEFKMCLQKLQKEASNLLLTSQSTIANGSQDTNSTQEQQVLIKGPNVAVVEAERNTAMVQTSYPNGPHTRVEALLNQSVVVQESGHQQPRENAPRQEVKEVILKTVSPKADVVEFKEALRKLSVEASLSSSAMPQEGILQTTIQEGSKRQDVIAFHKEGTVDQTTAPATSGHVEFKEALKKLEREALMSKSPEHPIASNGTNQDFTPDEQTHSTSTKCEIASTRERTESQLCMVLGEADTSVKERSEEFVSAPQHKAVEEQKPPELCKLEDPPQQLREIIVKTDVSKSPELSDFKAGLQKLQKEASEPLLQMRQESTDEMERQGMDPIQKTSLIKDPVVTHVPTVLAQNPYPSASCSGLETSLHPKLLVQESTFHCPMMKAPLLEVEEVVMKTVSPKADIGEFKNGLKKLSMESSLSSFPVHQGISMQTTIQEDTTPQTQALPIFPKEDKVEESTAPPKSELLEFEVKNVAREGLMFVSSRHVESGDLKNQEHVKEGLNQFISPRKEAAAPIHKTDVQLIKDHRKLNTGAYKLSKELPTPLNGKALHTQMSLQLTKEEHPKQEIKEVIVKTDNPTKTEHKEFKICLQTLQKEASDLLLTSQSTIANRSPETNSTQEQQVLIKGPNVAVVEAERNTTMVQTSNPSGPHIRVEALLNQSVVVQESGHQQPKLKAPQQEVKEVILKTVSPKAEVREFKETLRKLSVEASLSSAVPQEGIVQTTIQEGSKMQKQYVLEFQKEGTVEQNTAPPTSGHVEFKEALKKMEREALMSISPENAIARNGAKQDFTPDDQTHSGATKCEIASTGERTESQLCMVPGEADTSVKERSEEFVSVPQDKTVGEQKPPELSKLEDVPQQVRENIVKTDVPTKTDMSEFKIGLLKLQMEASKSLMPVPQSSMVGTTSQDIGSAPGQQLLIESPNEEVKRIKVKAAVPPTTIRSGSQTQLETQLHNKTLFQQRVLEPPKVKMPLQDLKEVIVKTVSPKADISEFNSLKKLSREASQSSPGHWEGSVQAKIQHGSPLPQSPRCQADEIVERTTAPLKDKLAEFRASLEMLKREASTSIENKKPDEVNPNDPATTEEQSHSEHPQKNVVQVTEETAPPKMRHGEFNANLQGLQKSSYLLGMNRLEEQSSLKPCKDKVFSEAVREIIVKTSIPPKTGQSEFRIGLQKLQKEASNSLLALPPKDKIVSTSGEKYSTEGNRSSTESPKKQVAGAAGKTARPLTYKSLAQKNDDQCAGKKEGPKEVIDVVKPAVLPPKAYASEFNSGLKNRFSEDLPSSSPVDQESCKLYMQEEQMSIKLLKEEGLPQKVQEIITKTEVPANTGLSEFKMRLKKLQEASSRPLIPARLKSTVVVGDQMQDSLREPVCLNGQPKENTVKTAANKATPPSFGPSGLPTRQKTPSHHAFLLQESTLKSPKDRAQLPEVKEVIVKGISPKADLSEFNSGLNKIFVECALPSPVQRETSENAKAYAEVPAKQNVLELSNEETVERRTAPPKPGFLDFKSSLEKLQREALISTSPVGKTAAERNSTETEHIASQQIRFENPISWKKHLVEKTVVRPNVGKSGLKIKHTDSSSTLNRTLLEEPKIFKLQKVEQIPPKVSEDIVKKAVSSKSGINKCNDGLEKLPNKSDLALPNLQKTRVLFQVKTKDFTEEKLSLVKHPKPVGAETVISSLVPQIDAAAVSKSAPLPEPHNTLEELRNISSHKSIIRDTVLLNEVGETVGRTDQPKKDLQEFNTGLQKLLQEHSPPLHPATIRPPGSIEHAKENPPSHEGKVVLVRMITSSGAGRRRSSFGLEKVPVVAPESSSQEAGNVLKIQKMLSTEKIFKKGIDHSETYFRDTERDRPQSAVSKAVRQTDALHKMALLESNVHLNKPNKGVSLPSSALGKNRNRHEDIHTDMFIPKRPGFHSAVPVGQDSASLQEHKKLPGEKTNQLVENHLALQRGNSVKPIEIQHNKIGEIKREISLPQEDKETLDDTVFDPETETSSTAIGFEKVSLNASEPTTGAQPAEQHGFRSDPQKGRFDEQKKAINPTVLQPQKGTPFSSSETALGKVERALSRKEIKPNRKVGHQQGKSLSQEIGDAVAFSKVEHSTSHFGLQKKCTETPEISLKVDKPINTLEDTYRITSVQDPEIMESESHHVKTRSSLQKGVTLSGGHREEKAQTLDRRASLQAGEKVPVPESVRVTLPIGLEKLHRKASGTLRSLDQTNSNWADIPKSSSAHERLDDRACVGQASSAFQKSNKILHRGKDEREDHSQTKQWGPPTKTIQPGVSAYDGHQEEKYLPQEGHGTSIEAVALTQTELDPFKLASPTGGKDTLVTSTSLHKPSDNIEDHSAPKQVKCSTTRIQLYHSVSLPQHQKELKTQQALERAHSSKVADLNKTHAYSKEGFRIDQDSIHHPPVSQLEGSLPSNLEVLSLSHTCVPGPVEEKSLKYGDQLKRKVEMVQGVHIKMEAGVNKFNERKLDFLQGAERSVSSTAVPIRTLEKHGGGIPVAENSEAGDVNRSPPGKGKCFSASSSFIGKDPTVKQEESPIMKRSTVKLQLSSPYDKDNLPRRTGFNLPKGNTRSDT